MIGQIEVIGDREVAAHFGVMSEELRQAVAAKIAQFTSQLWEKVVHQKLAGEVLQRRSGKLAESIKQRIAHEGDTITGTVYSDGSVPYAGIQEYGGKTGAHDILPVKAQALHFLMGGRDVFAKIVHHPGSTIPEHSFLRSALADMVPAIEDGFRALVAAKMASGAFPAARAA
jgi:phage gpG-like protein